MPRIDGADGKYRLLAELGQGGTATVYLAVALGPHGFKKLVVVKTLKKALADDPEFQAMFVKEARIAARLNHPNIVQTYETLEEQGASFIVMEYLQGQPLSRILLKNRGQLKLDMQLRILADTLNGLEHAHELKDFDGTPLGLVHRDLSPHNLLVTYEGQAKVLDFGIAKLTASLPETRTGVMKGKLRYMPPEQMTADPIDRRADIYALGVVLWEMLTGKSIWKGFSEATIMNRVLAGEIPSPREVAPEVPRALDAICRKAMSPDRNDRFTTAAAFEAAIEAEIEELGSRATSRTIGKAVSEMFRDAQTETQALIESQMSTVMSLSWQQYEARTTPSLAPSAETDSGVSSTKTGTAAVRITSTRRRVITAAAVLGLLFLAGFLIARAPERVVAAKDGTESAALQAKPAVASEAPLVPAPTREGPSAGARVVAGEESAAVPEATPGPVPSPANPTPATAPRTRTRKPTGSKTKPNCDPPYAVDRAGIKRFKPECL